MNRRCDRCGFWQVGPLKRNGDCRRNPPPWRQTGEEDWCGEFRLRQELENEALKAESDRLRLLAQSHSRASDPFGLGLSPLIGQKSSGF